MKPLIAFLLLGLAGCNPGENSLTETLPPMKVVVEHSAYDLEIPGYDSLYNKILGSLVGSAIGDAFGAPSEMWGRQDRRTAFGFIDSLDASFIDPSPEGLWDFHLPAGATTDDTRWKFLVGNYMIHDMGSFYNNQGPSPQRFSQYVLASYQDEIANLKSTATETEYDSNFRRLFWLQEWAKVAKPFSEGDLEAYTTALHRFYGGELLCAGMLYAPAVALPYPGNPLKAYQAAYRLGIFDQGYARDITGLTASMVAAALSYKATPNSVMEVFHQVDPHDYLRSRLLGRIAFKTFREAQKIVEASHQLNHCESEDLSIMLVKGDTLQSCRLQRAYTLLDQQNQHAPAHAQEILLVTLTAILYSNFDFQATMEFITNYGRDNDTSGAVAGAILGAYDGYDELPDNLKNRVLITNKRNLNIDLEDLAKKLTEEILKENGS